ncbi:MAG: enhanced serine sensitivity protein SseB C-terminal domain-containing protein [Zoogloea sp.]|nr:enhanced serine sensitivity protein SseB C-terminal domain-containing protein [Zoogloea sp.]
MLASQVRRLPRASEFKRHPPFMTNEKECPLEAALRRAAEEPGHRPEFYRLLLESSVLILGHSNTSHGTQTLEAGETISIQNWVRDDGSPVIPFFTSLTALHRSIEQEVTYMALPARSLFEITKGSPLVLNPKSSYGKEFFPNEIEALLAEGVNQLPKQRVAYKATKVLLGQPADYPSKMVDSLTTLLSKHSNVKAAYLALMHDPSKDTKPHLVVGIEVDGEIENVMREAGVVASDSAPNGGPVDLIQIERGDLGLSEYFVHEVKPFYERRWGSKLKSLLGIGHA